MISSITCFGCVLVILAILCQGEAAARHRSNRVKRIVGGHEPASKDNYGYVASIQSFEGGKLKHLCGGSYIGNGWVLTAAHCLIGKNWNYFYIRLGAENLSTTTVKNTYRVLEVKQNNFVPIFLTNDIALLRINLNGSAPMSVRYANKPILSNANCEIGGFGSPSFNAPVSDSYRVAPIAVVPMFTCILRLGFIVVPAMSGNALCAGGGVTDTCQGDSGSALICDGVLTGITSYGRDCGVEGVPAVYTNVEKYSHWIYSIVNSQH